FVVTTHAHGVDAGCLVGFASQASIQPPRFLVGLSNKNHTFRVAADAAHLAVHLFDTEHLEVAELFGGQTGDTVNKFDRCACHGRPAPPPRAARRSGRRPATSGRCRTSRSTPCRRWPRRRRPARAGSRRHARSGGGSGPAPSTRSADLARTP